MSLIEVNGRRMRCRVTGDGQPVRLSHGIARSLEDWTEQHEMLEGGAVAMRLALRYRSGFAAWCS